MEYIFINWIHIYSQSLIIGIITISWKISIIEVNKWSFVNMKLTIHNTNYVWGGPSFHLDFMTVEQIPVVVMRTRLLCSC